MKASVVSSTLHAARSCRVFVGGACSQRLPDMFRWIEWAMYCPCST